MQEPQLIEVDPQRIRFNTDNPRQHGGMEFALLKNSVKEVGLVQFPALRVLAGGGLYEVIDGEGRVRAAQEERLPRIWAVSLGTMSDAEALTKLQAANTVRNFSYIAQCRGFAKLNRQGKTVEELSRQFGGTSKPSRILIDMVAMGNLPDDVLDMILEDMARSVERENLWTSTALTRELLTLRQVVPGKNEHGGHTGSENYNGERGAVDQSTSYDYTEVRKVVEQIVHGDEDVITNVITSITRHRVELFQERFDQELQVKLAEEIARTRATLEETATSKVHDAVHQVEEETRRAYEERIARLQAQLDDTHKRYEKIVKEVAKRPEAVTRLETELRERLTALDKERTDLLQARLKVQQEADAARQRAVEQALAEARRQAEAELARQRVELQQQYEQAEADLKEYYAHRSEELRVKNERTVQQLVARAVELMAQTQQQVTLLTASGMLEGMELLQAREKASLLGQMDLLKQVLSRAQERLEHGEVVIESGKDITYDYHQTRA